MSALALDDFLVSKLESVMAKSSISPYEIARFCFTGSILAGLGIIFGSAAVSDYIGTFIWMCGVPCSIIRYFDVSLGEEDNNSGKLNRHKANGTGRLIFISLCLLGIAELYLSHLAKVPVSSYLVLYSVRLYLITHTAALYFGCLNWIPPAKKESESKISSWMKLKYARTS